ncbi:MAG: hypothetical protein VX899_14570 [Myxococcota bacterium]|nr:hypothetical protein [Myxococcota bacterium]
MLRLKCVEIKKYQSLEPTSLEFGDGPVFLLGKNGTGKSTLLELLRRLTALDFAPFKAGREAVDVRWELVLSLRGMEQVWSFEFFYQPGEKESWRLSAQNGQRKDTGALGWELQSRTKPTTWGWKLDDTLPLPSVFDPGFFTVLTYAMGNQGESSAALLERLVRIVGSRPMDEALGIYDAVFGSNSFASVVVDKNASESSWVMPLLVLRALNEEDPALVSGEAAPLWLDKAAETLEAEKIILKLRRESRSPDGGSWRGVDAEVVWPGGYAHAHTQLSFGQRRVLAFFWYMSLTDGVPVFTDELTNGLHADWVQDIVDYLDGVQAFHAVQNPLLPDFVGLAKRQDTKGSFLFCRVGMHEGRRRWTWRNPTEEEAGDVWDAWDVGIQNLSEVLRSRGRFVLYSEDKPKSAGASRNLAKRAMQCLEPNLRTHEIGGESSQDKQVVRACEAQAWRGKRAGAVRKALLRDLKTRIATGQWVVFHLDADVPWGGLPPVLDVVEKQLFAKLEPRERAKVLLMVPHYSLEAWLYLNKKAVAELAARQPTAKLALVWLEENADPKGGLDHLLKPKDRCPIHDKYNDLLSERWPWRQAASKSPSWGALLEAWGANDTLMAQLAELSP